VDQGRDLRPAQDDRPRVLWRSRQDDPSPPGLRQVQVGFAEHDRLRRAQRRVIEAGEERLQVLSPLPQPSGGVQERLGLGGSAALLTAVGALPLGYQP
jgi:hypothetical protein